MNATEAPTRIVICEDSRTYAHALTRFLERDDDLRVVKVCSSAEELLRVLPDMRPDLITMDIELPGLDGLGATRRIMDSGRLPILVLSAHAGWGSEHAAAALEAGALDAIAKSDIHIDDLEGHAAVALRRRIKRLATTRMRPAVASSPAAVASTAAAVASSPAAAVASTAAAVASSPAAVASPPAGVSARPSPWGRASGTSVGIVASTGGPAALMALLAELPGDFPLPVLIVQHIAAGFAPGLARWLDGVVKVPVALAEHEVAAGPGVWLAPDDAHLRLVGSMLSLDRQTVAGPFRPSGDILLKSLARAAGSGAVSVVLTGMGRDGAEGTASVRAAGGLTIAQDEASSVVYGMPQAAVDRGAELMLAPEAIGQALSALRGAGVSR